MGDKKPMAFGPLVPARPAWIVMESPAFLLALTMWYLRDPTADANLTNWILIGMFLLHYLHRAFIFPFRMKSGNPMPFNIMMMAWVFCLLNGYLQGRAISHFSVYPEGDYLSLRFIAGVLLFAFGLFTNIQSDSILFNLRKPGEEKKYKIPTGGMFTYVSAANFFGEIVEWAGFALACNSLAGVAFAIFTFSNIGPRGYANHLDLKRRFPQTYPESRKAVIPFIW